MNEYVDPQKSQLHGLFVALFYICLVALVLALLTDFCNGLDDFLHAPIGIKDNPPEPGAIVQLAQLSRLPLLLLTLLLGLWAFFSSFSKTIPTLLVPLTVISLLTSVVGGAVIMMNNDKQDTWFTQTVTPIAWGTCITSCVVLAVYQKVVEWRKPKPK